MAEQLTPRHRTAANARTAHAEHAAHPAGRTMPSWLLTTWAALAALAVCLVAVVYTPLETPVAWRSAETAVVSLGRHALPDDGLRI